MGVSVGLMILCVFAADKPKQPDPAARFLSDARAAAANLKGTDRGYALWLISRGYAHVDPKKEKVVLAESCESLFTVVDNDEDVSFREKIEGDCLRRLSQVWPQRAAKLIPRADADVRQQILAMKAPDAAKARNVDEALNLLSSEISQGASYPYSQAIQVISELPADDRDAKDRILAQALTIYKQKNDRYAVGTEDLGTMIVRFRKDFSPGLVLEAIDTLLDSAREESAEDFHMEVSVKSKSGALSFGSLYQYRLFQLLPALRDLDPQRADTLLKESSQVNSALQDHADGLQSLSPNYTDPQLKDPSLTFVYSIKDGPPAGSPRSSDILGTLQLEVRADQILQAAAKDPSSALEDASGFPDQLFGNRAMKAELLMGIADAAFKEHESVSFDALHQLGKLVEPYPVLLQSRYLVQLADRYLRHGEPEDAMPLIALGMKNANKLYAIDINSDDPNRVLKSSWPSTTVSRGFVALAARVSVKFADQMLQEIQDPDIRVFDRIEIASTLSRTTSYPAIMQRQTKESPGVAVDTFPIPSAH